MILDITEGHLELREHENLRAFKVCVRGQRLGLADVRQALAGRVGFPDEATAWVAEQTLRQWPTLKDSAAWQQALTAMIEKARPHGWVDPATGAIKAHVEWPDGEP
ncbi:hypothetical protein [Chelatococcus reniformis]|uniref:Uncharacterized protein n=1 Tax=Chelatococcus reniformis TaxID=1494448 RepID=A0A916XKC0_9HYPH|nr:hypothetical protein [Chelatococcus reniformis]GGC77998.1 hypothetical protein GCM10010994_40310 [Chelatococcus reniformis]